MGFFSNLAWVFGLKKQDIYKGLIKRNDLVWCKYGFSNKNYFNYIFFCEDF